MQPASCGGLAAPARLHAAAAMLGMMPHAPSHQHSPGAGPEEVIEHALQLLIAAAAAAGTAVARQLQGKHHLAACSTQQAQHTAYTQSACLSSAPRQGSWHRRRRRRRRRSSTSRRSKGAAEHASSPHAAPVDCKCAWPAAAAAPFPLPVSCRLLRPVGSRSRGFPPCSTQPWYCCCCSSSWCWAAGLVLPS